MKPGDWRSPVQYSVGKSVTMFFQRRSGSMKRPPGLAGVCALPPAVRAPANNRSPQRAAPGTILLLGIGIGLCAGFLDLGLLTLKHRLTGDGFYRLGDQFRWIIPSAVAALVILPATLL